MNGSYVILITDGLVNAGPDPLEWADVLRESHHEIFGIGVGPKAAKKMIQSWCSGPISTHYFNVTDYASLHTILDQVVENVCPKPPLKVRARVTETSEPVSR